MDGYCEGIGSVGCEMVFFRERTGKQRCSQEITPQLTHYRQLTRRLLAVQIHSSSRETPDLRFPIGREDSQMGPDQARGFAAFFASAES